ncbi:AraC family transcriptional regulator [Anaerococcus sp. AGMB00486]|uniref:AraC family transcriptional regulator n=3 Tax=Anaerococcus TaxID=165779 RepID=A0ABX2N745_9FIRM|nr:MULTISPECIES: AraC family transcriptional regulator [Anaerococcus]MDY3007114.1 AraC family transcriptional regulator [Anaerococcus porci]MSS77044.1 AraC family transcriptional regulator [Anaerococcus porci]NVF10468.1 AraC family transcriptional regulator [Anaerococcus faecalis]
MVMIDNNENDNTAMQSIYLNVLYAKKNSSSNKISSRIHFHPFTEFYFIIDGNGKFSIEDKMIDVKKDDFLIINSNVGHSIYSSKDDENLIYVSFGVDSIFVKSVDNNENLEEDKYYYNSIDEMKDYFLNSFNDINNEFNSKDPYSKSMANAKASEFVITLLRNLSDEFKITNDIKINKQIDYIKNFIDNNYSEDIRLENLSKMAYMNKFHLISEFKQNYRVTPIEYLILKRIEVTKNLLISTNHSMEEISSIVGFNSQSYFNQVFKKKVGITPSQFRKNHRI